MTRSLNVRLSSTTAEDCITTFTAEGINPATGEVEPIDLTGLSIVFVVRNGCGTQAWRGEVASGVTPDISATGEFTVWIPVATMRTLCAGDYALGCTLSDNIVTTQFLLGTLSVTDGVV